MFFVGGKLNDSLDYKKLLTPDLNSYLSKQNILSLICLCEFVYLQINKAAIDLNVKTSD